MTSAIVTTSYRYKRPPRKAVAVEAPAVVTAKSSRRPPVWGKEKAAEVDAGHPSRGEAAQPSTPREAARDPAPPASATKPMIVTTGRKHRAQDALPMELPLSRKPVERDGDEYKRLKAAMARRLRSE